MTQLLVATDFSSRAEQALRMGVLIARANNARLKLVYGIDRDQPQGLLEVQRDATTLMLQRLANTIEKSDEVPCTAEVSVAGHIDEAILAAVEPETELLILGRHRTRPIRDLFLRSTSERVISHTTTPTLVVQSPPLEPYQHLLLATDLSAHALETAQRVVSHPLTAGLATSVLHIVGDLESAPITANRMDEAAQEAVFAQDKEVARQQLNALIYGAGLSPATPLIEEQTDLASATITSVAERERADLIAIHRHQTSMLEGFFNPSVTTRLLNGSPIDLLIL